MDFKGLFFIAEGRLNRLSFFLLAILVGVVFSILSVVVGLILPYGVAIIVSAILYIVNTIIGIFLIIKRFHDFDKSGYYMLGYSIVAFIIILAISSIFTFILNNETLSIGFAVIAALAVVLYVYLKPGTAGANQYGNQPAALFDLGLNDNKENLNPIISDNSNNQ